MGLKKSYNAWRAGRQVHHELSSLSQRELADIGIFRSDIPRIARQARKDAL